MFPLKDYNGMDEPIRRFRKNFCAKKTEDDWFAACRFLRGFIFPWFPFLLPFSNPRYHDRVGDWNYGFFRSLHYVFPLFLFYALSASKYLPQAFDEPQKEGKF